MRSQLFFALLLAAVLLASQANAHLCMFNPRQRGNLTIDKPSGTCGRPIAPCGNLPPETPQVTINSGSSFVIHFQQNLNHYSVGYPGYFDIAYATYTGADLTDKDFSIVGYVPDYFAHRELSMTNFTYDFQVPSNLECDHCVIRMRYITHKPGEPIFHQCTDVKIVKSRKSFETTQQVAASDFGRLVGIYYNPVEDPLASLVEVLVDGKTAKLKKLVSLGGAIREFNPMAEAQLQRLKNRKIITQYYNNRRMANVVPALLNSVAAFDQANRVLYFLTSLSSNLDAVPQYLTSVNLDTLVTDYVAIKNSLDAPISGMVYEPSLKGFLFIRIAPQTATAHHHMSHKKMNKLHGDAHANGIVYQFQVTFYDPQTKQEKLIATMPAEDYYIDYVWSTYDATNQVLYILRRNEHDPFDQAQLVYPIDIKTGSIVYEPKFTNINASFSNMQWTGKFGGELIGFVQGNPGWTNLTYTDFGLYKIRPKTGETELVQLVNREFDVKQWYGGNVFNLNGNQVYYQFFKQGKQGKVILSGYALAEGQWLSAVESEAFNFLYNVISVPGK